MQKSNLFSLGLPNVILKIPFIYLVNVVSIYPSIQHASAKSSTKTRSSDRVPPSPLPSKFPTTVSNIFPYHSAGITGLQTALTLQAANYLVTIIAEYIPGDENALYTSPWCVNRPSPPPFLIFSLLSCLLHLCF